MSKNNHAKEVLRLLREANLADRQLRRDLTRIAEGQLVLSQGERDALKHTTVLINELLLEMGDARNVKLFRRTVEDARPEIEVPKTFREAYERLHLRSYQAQTSPAMTSERGMAVYGKRGMIASGKPTGDSSRSIIRDRRAWEFKRKVDRRLRKLGAEVELFLEGYNGNRTEQKRCSGCSKVGEDDWTYCPRCGKEMQWVETPASQG